MSTEQCDAFVIIYREFSYAPNTAINVLKYEHMIRLFPIKHPAPSFALSTSRLGCLPTPRRASQASSHLSTLLTSPKRPSIQSSETKRNSSFLNTWHFSPSSKPVCRLMFSSSWQTFSLITSLRLAISKPMRIDRSIAYIHFSGGRTQLKRIQTQGTFAFHIHCYFVANF